MNQRKNFPFGIFTISVLCALILPTLLKDGMFMDGLLYADISKNLSEGIGTFWQPHFSKTLYPYFDQQPPLGFWIQSIFFNLLGESIYVERFYSFLTCLLSAFLISHLWKIIFKNEKEVKQISWFPILLWIIIPLCFWSYSNNVLENTMVIFDLLAIIFVVKFFNSEKMIFIFIAGIYIFLASLTKGFQGMFPLASIFFGWFVYRNISFGKMILSSLALIAVPVLIYFLLFQNAEAHESLMTYFNHRILYSIQTQSTVDLRFYIVFRLLGELAAPVGLSVIIFFLSPRGDKTQFVSDENKKHFYFFSLIGISASLPLMITLEQRGFYLATSFPFFAISIAVLNSPSVSTWVKKKSFQIFKWSSIILLCAVLVFASFQIGKVGRDKEIINDIHLIGKIIPKGAVLGSTRKLWEEWALQEHLIRHYYICQDDKIRPENDFLLLESEKDAPKEMKIEKVNIPTIKYHLYKVVK